MIYNIKNALRYDGPVCTYMPAFSNNCKEQTRLVINDEHLSKRLCELGMVQRKSLVLEWPKELDECFYSAFIRGYFDGDGCVCYDAKRNKLMTNICGTKEMCDIIGAILTNLGIKHNVWHPKQCGQSNTYVIRTAGNKSSYALLDFIYDNATMYLQRKYDIYIEHKKEYSLSRNNESRK